MRRRSGLRKAPIVGATAERDGRAVLHVGRTVVDGLAGIRTETVDANRSLAVTFFGARRARLAASPRARHAADIGRRFASQILTSIARVRAIVVGEAGGCAQRRAALGATRSAAAARTCSAAAAACTRSAAAAARSCGAATSGNAATRSDSATRSNGARGTVASNRTAGTDAASTGVASRRSAARGVVAGTSLRRNTKCTGHRQSGEGKSLHVALAMHPDRVPWNSAGADALGAHRLPLAGGRSELSGRPGLLSESRRSVCE